MPDKYRQLIESIELNKIELLSLNCSQNKDFPAEKRNSLDIALKNNIVKFELDGIELQVEAEFGVIAFNSVKEENETTKMEDIKNEDILFKIDFSLLLSYVLDMENTENLLIEFDEEIDAFVNKNVPINAWPYVRETISSMTTRMGYPALVIPTYKNLPPQ